jgi:predicted PurR-regulated permease PerM
MKDEHVHKIEISAKTIIFAVVLLILLQAVWIVRELIFSFIIAFIVMSAFNPVVTWFEKWRIPRVISTLIVFALTITGIGFLFAWLIPPVVKETTVLFKNFPEYLKNFELGSDAKLSENLFSQYGTSVTNGAFDFLRSTFSNVIFLISTIFFSFYFLIEEHVIRRFLMKVFDKKNAGAIAETFDKAELRMRAWLWGQLILMLAIGLVTYIGLTVLGVRYALPLAVFAGLLEIVPILGPTLSAIPAFIVTASQNMFSGLSVIALYFIIQQVENQVLVPVVMRRAVGLNPILTLAALIVGGKLGGILGLLLAIPITLCVETVVSEMANMKSNHEK